MKLWHFLFIPFSGLFLGVVWTKNLLFRMGILSVKKLRLPVISIGNLTFGGTGKTPVIQFLTQFFLKDGINPLIVCKGYKSQASHPRKVVSPQSPVATELYGDEPTFLAQRFPTTGVYVGRNTLETCRFAEGDSSGANVLLVDDAFQHRKLYRDADIVILDCSRPLSEYLPAPFGRAREGLSALARADAVFLTKVNLASASVLSDIRRSVSENASERTWVFEFEFNLSHIFCLGEASKRRSLDVLKNERIILLSGLGNPEAFAGMIRSQAEAEIVHHFIFPDHHTYTLEDIERACSFTKKQNVGKILVSEKDAVKLKVLMKEEISRFWVTELELTPRDPEGVQKYLQSLKGKWRPQ